MKPHIYHLLILSSFSIIVYCCTNQTATDNETTKQEELEMEGRPGTPVEDADGNIYPTVIIGEQTWMAVNLRNTTSDCQGSTEMIFTNGVERGPGVKFYDGQARYGYYLNKTDRLERFGALYSYKAISECNLCPDGYRIPSKADWEILLHTLGGLDLAGKKLRKRGGTSGFDGELAGRIDGYGSVLQGRMGYWWSIDLDSNRTTQDTTKKRAYVLELVSTGDVDMKPSNVKHGISVRCIKK